MVVTVRRPEPPSHGVGAHTVARRHGGGLHGAGPVPGRQRAASSQGGAWHPWAALLADQEHRIELRPLRYRFPAVIGDRYNDNWLTIEGEVTTPEPSRNCVWAPSWGSPPCRTARWAASPGRAPGPAIRDTCSPRRARTARPDRAQGSAPRPSSNGLVPAWRSRCPRTWAASRSSRGPTMRNGALIAVSCSAYQSGSSVVATRCVWSASIASRRPPSLRRILIDMVEEYARHVGHADLIRESVDGLVGEDPPR